MKLFLWNNLSTLKIEKEKTAEIQYVLEVYFESKNIKKWAFSKSFGVFSIRNEKKAVPQ